MHPHNNPVYQARLTNVFKVDYRRYILQKNGDELDLSYDKQMTSLWWKENIVLLAGMTGIILYDRKVTKPAPTEGLSRRRLMVMAVGYLTTTVIQGLIHSVGSNTEVTKKMALKYEPQLLMLHPELRLYYQPAGAPPITPGMSPSGFGIPNQMPNPNQMPMDYEMPPTQQMNQQFEIKPNQMSQEFDFRNPQYQQTEQFRNPQMGGDQSRIPQYQPPQYQNPLGTPQYQNPQGNPQYQNPLGNPQYQNSLGNPQYQNSPGNPQYQRYGEDAQRAPVYPGQTNEQRAPQYPPANPQDYRAFPSNPYLGQNSEMDRKG